MSPEDLADLFRSDVEDTDTADPLWTETEVFSYMDRAQKQFARKTDYFSDSTTAEIIQVTIAADDTFVDIDPRIIKIRGARLASTGVEVKPMTYDQVNRDGYGRDAYDNYAFSTNINWETATGNPTIIVTDMEKDKIRIVPIPTATTDTLNLRVYRLPLETVNADCPEFEITEEEYQAGLMYWMKYLAYQKNDSDVYNNELSQEALGLFNDFITETRRELRRIRFGSTTGTVKYGGL